MVIEQRKTPGIYTRKGRVRFYGVATILVSLSLCIGCSPKIKQENFQGVYRAGKAIDGSIAVGITHVKFQELLQSLATEISITNDKVKSQDEKKLVGMYSEILTMYLDSGILWDYKALGWERGGETYIDQDQPVTAIKAKYNLTTIQKDFDGERREMIPVDESIKAVWAKAHDQLEAANARLKEK